MTTKIQKWGNSLAVRIRKIFAENLGWKKGTKVYFRQFGNLLVISSNPTFSKRKVFLRKLS